MMEQHANEHQHHVVPVSIYIVIFVSLMILTGLTVFASQKDFGPGNTIIAVSIAALKATLVILYFMHVRYNDNIVRIAVFTGFLWLGVMIVLTLSDYIARGWLLIYW
ncbi:cytochrome C oxidase subunit IV family protein [bacterium]|nr:cytochrome C oxidase subunit IV family protein [bacterium]